ncbi:hypothetical protein LguiA_013681 [Lonicera macranthoides]
MMGLISQGGTPPSSEHHATIEALLISMQASMILTLRQETHVFLTANASIGKTEDPEATLLPKSSEIEPDLSCTSTTQAKAARLPLTSASQSSFNKSPLGQHQDRGTESGYATIVRVALTSIIKNSLTDLYAHSAIAM